MTYLVTLSSKPKFSIGYRFDRRIPPDADLMATKGERIPQALLAEMPTRLTLEPHKTDPPHISGQAAYWLVVEPFVELLDRFEPGLHQTSRVNVYTSRGQLHLGKFYLVFPGARIDAVITDSSNLLVKPGRVLNVDGQTHVIKPTYVVDLANFNVTIDFDQIRHHHFWFGGPRFRTYAFFSEAFAAAVRQRGIEGIEMYQCKEVIRNG